MNERRAPVNDNEPSPDQSYCEIGDHQHCSGYTEDESDPETCLCRCHDLPTEESA